uniref:hypothetical protein n=1 Tax=Streptomyces sp. YPW6 TaxID=2840373 RepID=UPI003D73C833
MTTASSSQRKKSPATKARKKARAKKKKDWIMGPVPEDIFSPANFQPEPKCPEARPIHALERLRYVVANPAVYEVAAAVLPGKLPGTHGRPPHYPPY